MINIHRRLQKENLRSRMILQVHDELVFEAPEDELAALSTLVREEMSQAIRLDVPIKVDVGVGGRIGWRRIDGKIAFDCNAYFAIF
jgi:DNA polymerase-1